MEIFDLGFEKPDGSIAIAGIKAILTCILSLQTC